jgi:hypothetical protein
MVNWTVENIFTRSRKMQPFPVQNFPVSAVADGVHQEFQSSTLMSNKGGTDNDNTNTESIFLSQ